LFRKLPEIKKIENISKGKIKQTVSGKKLRKEIKAKKIKQTMRGEPK
jgi:hypothetical protein